jgi:AcrR family transcriptional regulator
MPEPDQPRMRADARRNRERILEATRQLLVEQGADVPLDQIAARAGVSIATLYRRFEDRSALLRALVLDESAAIHASMEKAVIQVESGCSRMEWEETMHDLVVSATSRLSPVMVAVASGLIQVDEAIEEASANANGLFARLVESAQHQGLVRTDTDASEVQAMLMSATLPFPHQSAERNHEMASRKLYFLLAGLHPTAARETPIPGEPFHIDPKEFEG